MQSVQQLPRPLLQAISHSSSVRSASPSLTRAFSPRASTSTYKRPTATRSYATAPQDRMAELQAKQLKLAEKAGRMKQNIGVVSVGERVREG